MTNPRYANGALRRKHRARLKAMGAPCGICGGRLGPIHYDEPSDAAHPLSFVVDEIRPVARWREFGYASPRAAAEDWDNLQAAHYWCNAQKGCKLSPAKNNLIGGWYQNRKEKQKVAADTSNRARAEIAKRSAAERRKLAKFLAKNGLNDEKIKSLDPVILNVSWMKSKLDDAREAIGEEGITVEYDNGGGQSGVRENPAFRAYEALWKTYLSGLDMLIKLLPVEVPQEQISDIKPTSVLTLVQNRRKQDA